MSKLKSALQHTFNSASAALSWLSTGTPEHGISAAAGLGTLMAANGKTILKQTFTAVSGAVSWLSTGTPDHGLSAAEGMALVIAARSSKTPRPE